MRHAAMVVGIGILMLAGCSGGPEGGADQNAAQPANVAESTPVPPVPPPGTGPDAKTPLAEPKGPIDPKSAEAAGQVVQSYGALIEQGNKKQNFQGDPDSQGDIIFNNDNGNGTRNAYGDLLVGHQGDGAELHGLALGQWDFLAGVEVGLLLGWGGSGCRKADGKRERTGKGHGLEGGETFHFQR